MFQKVDLSWFFPVKMNSIALNVIQVRMISYQANVLVRDVEIYKATIK